MIAIRIVNLDYYSTEPGPFDHTLTPFSDQELKKVTVLRVYGTTFAGQKVCVHIHQVYHYFYVRFPIDSSKPIQQSIFDLGSALNQALDLTQGSEQTKQQHIAAVVLVKGIPFYGYHNQHETFLKIHMVNPYEKQRMIDLLQSGVINDTKYQPFEAHINFDLQFLIDHNLYGMDWMYVNDSRKSGTQFRLPLSPEPMVDCTQSDDCLLYLSHTVPKHLQSDLIKKASYSELELDIMGMSILNRLSVKERDIHNSLYDVVSQQEGQKKKYLKSLESIWKEETTRLGEYEQASEFSTLRTSQYIPWIVEGNLRKNMERMMSGTTLQSPNKDEPILENIKTAFQSIEELYPEEYNDLQKEENQSLAHKMDEPHSFMGFPSMDLDLPAKRASQNIGSQQNRSQPDLFSASQAQPSLLNSDIMKSFILEAEKSQGAMQEEAEEEVNQSDEENGDEADFSIIYGGNDAEEEDIIKWINKIDKEREEKTTCRNPVNIEYEDDIVISEIPPVDQQTLYLREVKKRYRINQLDGADDDDDGSSDHKKTPDDEWKRISRANRNEKLMLLKKRRAQIEKKRSKVKVGQYKVSVVISEKDSILSRLENMRKAPKASKKRKRLLISDSESSEKEEEERKEEKKIKNERPIIEEKSSNEDLQSIPNPAMMSSQKSTESLQYFTKHIDAMWSPQCSSESQSHTNSDDFFKRNNPTPGSPILTRKKPFFQSQPSSHIMDYDLGDQDFLHSEKSVSPIASQRESQLSQHIYPSTVDSDADIQVPLDSDLENWSIVQQTVANEKDSTPKITKTIDQLPSTESREFVCSVPPPVMDPNVKLPVVYKEPFYSKTEDVPRYPTVFSGKEFKLVSNSVKYLKEFQTKFTKKPDISRNLKSPHLFLEQTNIQSWTPTKDPPTLKDAEKWLEEQSEKPSKKTKVDPTSQLSGPTQDNTFGFKLKPIQSKPQDERLFIDFFSLELHVNTRENQLPDPEKDAIQAIFWCLQTENKLVTSNGYQNGYSVGIIAVRNFDIIKIGITHKDADITYAEDEIKLFKKLVEKVRYYDPDMLVGYEVQNASWGYLVERAEMHRINLLDELSRVEKVSYGIQKDTWGYKKSSIYKITGRHMLNVWRLMRNEVNLISYTIENVVYNLLHHRIPYFTHATLSSWYHGSSILKYRLFKYYLKRVQLNLDILEAAQVISRTCEQARVFGIDFNAVLTRGSQYKVESIMFRIAKPENYLLVSPNRRQVASQRSLECLPLVMEPLSQFYSSPMVVLDFQSLYPSIIIAYNYCYSTCLGRIRDISDASTLGVSSLDLPSGLLDTLKDKINVSPNGIMFVKPEVRKSLLARMLAELLETRVLVKKSMKANKDQASILRMLDAKQLTLKLIANVTYGYTAASYSGRMPCAEIADSIVQTGRETLERSIKFINETSKWGAKVVYGDTDSLFIYFPGKSKQEAFELGHEIADTITAMNPSPIKLKFEKVYHPSILLTKKRYVGFKYENPTDTEPVFEAKGIETVRRDGTAATQKIFETSLKILFRTQDMSQLKEYLYRQWNKMLANKVPVQDYIISKEVKLGTYSDRGGPHGAMVAQDNTNADHRAEPQYGERVPYVVVHRGPKAKLKDKVFRPEALLKDSSLLLDAEYYICKQIIPPLSRIFNLMGVDIQAWYDSMPRPQRNTAISLSHSEPKRSNRIDQYYATSHCIACHQLTDQALCETCLEQKDERNLLLISRQSKAEQRYSFILSICQGCSGLSPLDAMTAEPQEDCADIPCQSLDCTLFYERLKAKDKVRITSTYNSLLEY